jgi:hypothetical protein
MQPQLLAKCLLLAGTYETLLRFLVIRVPTNCGPDWLEETIQVARMMGLHVSAMMPENVQLIWDEIQYQVDACFVKTILENELFAGRVHQTSRFRASPSCHKGTEGED